MLKTISRHMIETAMELAQVDLENLQPEYERDGEKCFAISFDFNFGSLNAVARFMVELTGLFAEVTMDDEEPCVYEVINPARELADRMHFASGGGFAMASFPGVTLDS